MNEPSIFTRIINGEIPAHKVYEDDRTLAFLDIHPSRPGHTLVIPKVEVARIEDLSDDDYVDLMKSVQKVMRRQAEVFGADYRICLKVIGFDVPHVHVHVVPCKSSADFHAVEDENYNPDGNTLAEMARKLSF